MVSLCSHILYQNHHDMTFSPVLSYSVFLTGDWLGFSRRRRCCCCSPGRFSSGRRWAVSNLRKPNPRSCHTNSDIRGVSNQVNPMALAADTKAWLHCVKLSVLPKWTIGSDGDGDCDMRLPESFTWVIFQLVSLASSRRSWKRCFFVHCRSTRRFFSFPFVGFV